MTVSLPLLHWFPARPELPPLVAAGCGVPDELLVGDELVREVD